MSQNQAKNQTTISTDLKFVVSIYKLYLIFVAVIITVIYIFEESKQKGTLLRNILLKDMIGHQSSDIYDYFAQYSHLYDIPNEVPMCDYEKIKSKDFLIDYVQKSKPCLLKNYAKSWPAYTKWQNISYLIDKAGNEIIYTERAPLTSNQFAYFKKAFKKQYMTFSEFIYAINDPNRYFNYYFAQESVPKPLLSDIVEPYLGSQFLKKTEQAYWHGIGTVSLPHTDADENFMCVFKGYKHFSIVSPFQSKFVYPGVSKGDEILPINYSPLNFDTPDIKKYPLFQKAKVFRIKVEEGDCLFLPGNWWHQVTSSPTECIAVSTWYYSNSHVTNIIQEGLNKFD